MSTRSALSRIIPLAVVLAVLGAAGVAYAYTVPMVEQRLTTGSASYSSPAISGTKVVYTDGQSIYVLDLTTNVPRLLTSAGRVASPVISGDKVVYVQWPEGQLFTPEIWCYDLATSTPSRLTSSVSQDPAISGDRVVWTDYRNGAGDIYLYDLATHQESRLTTNPADQGSPAISGDNVVYADTRNGNPDIYRLNLVTHEETRLTTDPAAQTDPSIDGDWVAYIDRRNGNIDVYAFNLVTDREFPLTTDESDQYGPSVSGTKVVYYDHRNASWDIFLYDLATDRETTLTTDSWHQSNPVILGDRVVYANQQPGGHNEIYLGELATPRFTVSAPSTVGYGARAWVTGSLASITGIPMAGRWVTFETSPDGVWWPSATSARTTTSGAFAFSTMELTSARYIRMTYGGSDNELSAQSATMLVKPKASLGTPVAPSTMSRTKTYKIYGSLKPLHTAGLVAGTLQCYRLESGKWKLKKSFSLTAYDFSGYSRYRASVKLTSKGTWRMRAYHSDASHAPTYSAWRTVKVK